MMCENAFLILKGKEVNQGYTLTLTLDSWTQEGLPGRDFHWIAILESFLARRDGSTG